MNVSIKSNEKPKIGDKLFFSEYDPNIIDEVEEITVRKVHFKRGDGSSNNPQRNVILYLDENNNIIKEIDPFLEIIKR